MCNSGYASSIFSISSNKLFTTCNKLDGYTKTCCKVVLTTLIQTCCNKVITTLTTQGCNSIATSWLYQACYNVVTNVLSVCCNVCVFYTARNATDLMLQVCHQVASSLLASSSCIKPVGFIKLHQACYLHLIVSSL